jgi:hypothetical protein
MVSSGKNPFQKRWVSSFPTMVLTVKRNPKKVTDNCAPTAENSDCRRVVADVRLKKYQTGWSNG